MKDFAKDQRYELSVHFNVEDNWERENWICMYHRTGCFKINETTLHILTIDLISVLRCLTTLRTIDQTPFLLANNIRPIRAEVSLNNIKSIIDFYFFSFLLYNNYTIKFNKLTDAAIFRKLAKKRQVDFFIWVSTR